MMKDCSYHYDDKQLNMHHLEGDVWSHTVLAYNKTFEYKSSKYIKWAVVLHDLGRIYTRKEYPKESRVVFGDFEGVSCYVGMEILNKTDLSVEEKTRILKIISYQYVIIDYIKYNDPPFEELLIKFKYENELFEDLAEYVGCDIFGRVVNESRLHLYSNQRVEDLKKLLQNRESDKKVKTTKENNLYILVGPPCSKKSTWVSEQNGNPVVINRDSVTEKVGRKHGKNNYNEAYELMNADVKVKKEIDLLDEQIESAAKQTINRDVIIDNPNLKRKNRKEWIDALQETHKVIAVVFLAPFNEIIECNSKRGLLIGKSVSQKGIVNKLKTFTFPLFNEGIDEVLIC